MAQILYNHIDSYRYRSSCLQLIRPLTLSGTIGPIFVTTAYVGNLGSIRWVNFILVLVASLLVQMAINVYNDFFDFKNGQDTDKWVSEKDSLASYSLKYTTLPVIARTMLVFASFIGIWLSIQNGFWLAVIGVISIIVGILYSAGKHSLASIGLGEVTGALCLGFVVTFVAYIVQGYVIDLPIIMIAVLFSLLIALMILTNNIRDRKKDIGYRKTIAIKIGYKWAKRLLSTLLVAVYLGLIVLIVWGVVPVASFIALAAVPFAIRLRWSFRLGALPKEELNAMKLAALHHWAFSILLTIGIFIGA